MVGIPSPRLPLLISSSLELLLLPPQLYPKTWVYTVDSIDSWNVGSDLLSYFHFVDDFLILQMFGWITDPERHWLLRLNCRWDIEIQMQLQIQMPLSIAGVEEPSQCDHTRDGGLDQRQGEQVSADDQHSGTRHICPAYLLSQLPSIPLKPSPTAQVWMLDRLV